MRQGGHLHFRHHDIDEWASNHVLHLDEKDLASFHRRSGSPRHNLSADAPIMPDLVKPEWIAPRLTCRSKASVLDAMADLADSTELIGDKKELLDSLVEREKLCSTALSGGLALLHPRVHEPYMFFDSFIVVGKTIAQIPFGSPDRSTTDIFFLVCCQDDRIHLHVPPLHDVPPPQPADGNARNGRLQGTPPHPPRQRSHPAPHPSLRHLTPIRKDLRRRGT